jgi:hypothetical protein
MPKFTFILKYHNYLKNINNLSDKDDIIIYNERQNEIIIEGLIKTQPIEKSINIIKRRFPYLKIENGRDYGEIYIEGDFGILENYLPLINNLGYYISFLTLDGNNWIKKYDNNTIPLSLYLEPKYDLIIEDVPKVLFHTTPIKYSKNILKIGLIQKSKSKLSNHPERIYLTCDINYSKDYGDYIISNKIDVDYSVFAIYTTGLNLTLYRDINSDKNAFYILQNISPKNIKQIK